MSTSSKSFNSTYLRAVSNSKMPTFKRLWAGNSRGLYGVNRTIVNSGYGVYRTIKYSVTFTNGGSKVIFDGSIHTVSTIYDGSVHTV